MIFNLRKPKLEVDKITLCDIDSSRLCIVNFGADLPGNMIISFQLPDADYPLFHVKASNRGIVNDYVCEAVPDTTSVSCGGARAPLGEYLEVEVYSTAEEALMAQGRFIVSALIRTTPNSSLGIPTPTGESTPIPGTAYPNP